MKVSRVVMIVVALHVLVIGGIFIFEGCSRSQSNTPDMAANEALPGQQPEALASLPQTLQPGMTPQGLAPAAPMMPADAAATAPQPTTRIYTVKKGDSLWKIAKSQGTSVGELARVNNLSKTSTLQIGQKLQIPQSSAAETMATAAASVIPLTSDPAGAATALAASADAGQIYTVKSGDSLWKLARQHGLSVAAIKQANNLSSDMLKIGQQIRIPTAGAAATAPGMAAAGQTLGAGIATTASMGWREPGTYTENGQTVHVVDFNESPAIIAKKYGIKTEDLLRANNIMDPRRVEYGQRLIVPLAPPAPVSAAPPVSAPIVSASQVTIQ